MQKGWRRRVAVVLVLLGMLALSTVSLVARPAHLARAQEATRIPVFPMTPGRTITPVPAPTVARTPSVMHTRTRTLTPGATLAGTVPPTRTVTPTLDLSLFVPAVSAAGLRGDLFLPLVSSAAATATPGRIVQSVAGLQGTLERNPAGGERLRAPGGGIFALVPATTALDVRLLSLAIRAPLDVRISGTLYSTGSTDRSAFVVVTSIVAADEETATPLSPATPLPTLTPTSTATDAASLRPPTATPTPRPAPLAAGRFDVVNLHAGPSDQYARVGRIAQEQRCAIVGRTATGSWIELECTASRGWIEPRFVLVSGDPMDAPVVSVAPPTATPTSTPVPSPSPTPFAFAGWRTLYFANTTLAGVPAAVDDLPGVDYNWGSGTPRAGMPADGFSMRFERVVDFASGSYFFLAEADDGIRIFIDGQPVLDQYGATSGQTYRFVRNLSGPHALRVEYVEFSGTARVRFGWALASALRWAATYSGLQGSSTVMQQMEPDSGQFPLDYNWGSGSPAGAVGDNWMARWEARYPFAAGTWLFFAQADDGVRLYLDGILVLDKWNDGAGEVRNRFVGVGAGDHTVRVEYYQRTGSARVRVWWLRETPGGAVPQ